MAATTGGAVKARIESLGLGLPAFRDGAPAGQVYPFVDIQEGVAYRPLTEAHGDFGDPNGERLVREEVQVDLYQRARAGGAVQGRTTVAEDYDLADKLASGLDGCRLGLIGTARVSACRVTTRRRWPIQDNVLRVTLGVQIDRTVER